MTTTSLHKVILLLLAVSTMACETKVRFTGEQTSPELVMHADMRDDAPLSAYVGRTYFFLEQNIGNLHGFANADTTELAYGSVSNAMVEYKVNDGTWLPMTFRLVADSTGKRKRPLGKYYADSYTPKAGDIVQLRAQCEPIGTATAMQRIPDKADCRILSTHAEGNRLRLRLNLVPPEGDDVLAIALGCLITRQRADITDSVINYLFHSSDTLFGRYANLRSEALNYYPIRGEYLFVGTDRLRADNHPIDFYLNFQKSKFSTDSIKGDEHYELIAHVETWSRDKYNYFCTMAAYNRDYYDAAFIDFNDIDISSIDFTQLIEQVSATASSEFGVETGVQIFSNITGGIGHAGATALSNATSAGNLSDITNK